MTLIGFSRFQDNRRPLRVIRTIWIMLSFQTYRCTLRISNAFLSFHCSIKEISGIHLNSRFIRINRQRNSCSRATQFSSDLADIAFCFQYPIVVKSVSELHLFVIKFRYRRSNSFRSIKLKYEWFVMLMTVVLSVVASYLISTALSAVNE